MIVGIGLRKTECGSFTIFCCRGALVKQLIGCPSYTDKTTQHFDLCGILECPRKHDAKDVVNSLTKYTNNKFKTHANTSCNPIKYGTQLNLKTMTNQGTIWTY